MFCHVMSLLEVFFPNLCIFYMNYIFYIPSILVYNHLEEIYGMNTQHEML